MGLRKVFGSECISCVDGLNFGVGQTRPYLQMALLKAQLLSPIVRGNDGKRCLLFSSYVTAFQSKANRAAVDRKEHPMTEGRALISFLDLTEEARTKLLGMFDVPDHFVC